MCNFTVLFKYRKKLNILDLFNNAFSFSEVVGSYRIKLGPKQTHIQVAHLCLERTPVPNFFEDRHTISEPKYGAQHTLFAVLLYFVQERIKESEIKIKEKQLTVSYSCMTVKYADSHLRAPCLIVAINSPLPDVMKQELHQAHRSYSSLHFSCGH